MARVLIFLLLCFGLARPALADDIDVASRGVGRIIAYFELEDGRWNLDLGTGFAVSSRMVVTNYHVVSFYRRYEAQATDTQLLVVPAQGARPIAARLVSYDSGKDIALLELRDGTMSPLTLFEGTPPSDAAYTALGYPGNVDEAAAESPDDLVRSMLTPMPPIRTRGDISPARRARGVEIYVHDADIAQGNSGGPLVDRCGRVIGINVAVTDNANGDSASSFAISNGELIRFLNGAEVPFRKADGACITSEENVEACEAQLVRARDEALARCELENRNASATADREFQRQQEAARRNSETSLYISLLLLVVGGLGLGGSALLLFSGRRNPAIVAGAGGALLMISSVGVFLTRGDPSSIGDPDVDGSDCRAAAADAVARFESPECEGVRELQDAEMSTDGIVRRWLEEHEGEERPAEE